MTKEAAFRLASQEAKRHHRFVYVVWSNEEDDAPGAHYQYGADEAVDTFFSGSPVVACFGPDGSLESSI